MAPSLTLHPFGKPRKPLAGQVSVHRFLHDIGGIAVLLAGKLLYPVFQLVRNQRAGIDHKRSSLDFRTYRQTLSAHPADVNRSTKCASNLCAGPYTPSSANNKWRNITAQSNAARTVDDEPHGGKPWKGAASNTEISSRTRRRWSGAIVLNCFAARRREVDEHDPAMPHGCSARSHVSPRTGPELYPPNMRTVLLSGS